MAVAPQPDHQAYILSAPTGDDLCLVTAQSTEHAAALGLATLQTDSPDVYRLASTEWLQSGWPDAEHIRPADDSVGFVMEA